MKSIKNSFLRSVILLKIIKDVNISGARLFPIVEGGKGIMVSTGITAGHFAKNGVVGTFSGVNPEVIDDNGKLIPRILRAKSRVERQLEMIEHSIKGIVSQAKRAKDICGNNGRIHMNVLWEMGGTEKILNEALDKAKGLVHGITCGAGMPYKLSEIAAKYKVYYYPIVSSMRAFRALWTRSFSKAKDWLGGVVYECPWRAGGHNGLSNNDDPNIPGDSYERVKELRKFMNSVNLQNVPIIIAGGVWNIEEYESWIDNPEIGPIAFQFGTRSMVTQESPIPQEWKEMLLNLKEGDIIANRFSPTGFSSSAINNEFLQELQERKARQVEYSEAQQPEFNSEVLCGASKNKFYIHSEDKDKVQQWINAGFTEAVRTPEKTMVFMNFEKLNELKNDMRECHGCLSTCKFSCWSQYNSEQGYSSGKLPDFRSFCIQKTLQKAAQGIDTTKQLLFAGTNAYKFASDPFYNNGFIPTINQLVERIKLGK